MTQSSMLQSLPAPLQSLLREPTALTILASIGVHGLLWAALPYLPLMGARPTEAEIQREVGLVELSPEELARVPQAASQSSQPIPAAPLPSNNPGRLPQQFSLKPLPSPPPPQFPSVLPPSFYIPPPARLPLYIPPTAIRPRSTIPTRPVAPRPTSTPPARTPAPPQASPTPTRTPPASPTPPTPDPDQDLLPQVPGNGTPDATAPNQSPTPSPGDGSIAQNPGTPTPGTQSPSPSAPNGNTRPSDRPSPEPSPVPPRYTYSSDGTSVTAGRAAFQQWLSGLDRSISSSSDVTPISLVQPLPPAAIEQLPEAIRDEVRSGDRVVLASFGVVVGANNRIVGEPQLLQKSGFDAIDQQLQDRVANSDFGNRSGSERIYYVTVTLQPEGVADSP